MSAPTARRCAPRAAVSLGVTLARGKGSPLVSRTVDVGVGGMRVSLDRPLTIDERVSFDLELDGGAHVAGRARVLREERPRFYALCFEPLGQDATGSLSRLVNGSGPA